MGEVKEGKIINMDMMPVLYQNQVNKFIQIQQDYSDVKKEVKGKFDGLNRLKSDCIKLENKLEKHKDVRSMLDVLPFFRRTERVPDKINKSEYFGAIGLVSLAVLNGPEDMRDVISGYRQIKSKIKEREYKYSYDYKKMQHPFSFFRGTLLHNFVNPQKSRCPKFAKWLLKNDTTLYDSPLGRMTEKIFDIETKSWKTGIKHITHSEKSPRYILAKEFRTNSVFGELTARALIRTTKLGAIALLGIEAAHFIKEVQSGKNIFSAIKQSIITYVCSVAGIGYGGAIGAKYYGPAGSVIGMGLGAIIGNRVPKFINKS